jgi:vacuolar-type H+-ATPase subunit H
VAQQAPVVQQAPQQAPPQPPRSSDFGAPIVVTTGKEASAAVVRLVEMSTEQAERLVAEATEDANRIREEANRTAHQVTTDARTRAERVESEARVNAERVQADALSRAEKLDREIESRRGEMFGDLERQRDDLTAAVSALRNFEAAYRANLTNHLRSQIESLESGRAEPSETPDVIRDLRPEAASTNGSGNVEQHDGAQHPPAERDEAPTLGGGSTSSNTPRLDALLGDQR